MRRLLTGCDSLDVDQGGGCGSALGESPSSLQSPPVQAGPQPGVSTHDGRGGGPAEEDEEEAGQTSGEGSHHRGGEAGPTGESGQRVSLR